MQGTAAAWLQAYQAGDNLQLEEAFKSMSCHVQGLVILLCALGPEELNEVRLGPLTPHAVRTLRHLKAFFGATFSIKPQAASKTIFLSCIGAGVKNVSKRIS